MSKTRETIDATEVEAALPDDWWAENDGDHCVYAYSGEAPDAQRSATVELVGNCDGVWRATFAVKAPRGFHEPADDTVGAKAKVLRWLADEAESRDS